MQFGESADWRDEDLYAIGAQPLSGRRARTYRRLPWFRISLTSAACIALIAIYASDHENRHQSAAHSLLGEPPELVAPPSPWRNLAESSLVIIVHDERLTGLPLVHAAQIHDDGTLQDIIEIGRFRSNAPYFRVLLERKPVAATNRSFFVDLALNAAQAGLAVTRTLQEEALYTRTGRVEVARVLLEDGPQRHCLAYRSIDAVSAMQDPDLKQFGWLCAPELSREDLACAIDGLRLRHRETGLPLSAPIIDGSTKASHCPDPPDFQVVEAIQAGETTASLSGPQSPPSPPRRPSER